MKNRNVLVVLMVLCGLIPLIGQASEATDAVMEVATTQMSTVVRVNGQNVPVIYVGQADGCDSVAIQHASDRYEHFRVCDNQVIPRNTVSPSWTEEGGARAVLAAVVRNSILLGEASQTDSNGYLISARTLGALRTDCKNVEVIISYDGDLVDRALKSVCGKHR
ncbi:hypothetical protein [Pseudomonas fluorescens]|uniref:Uncharacterized protein n=1 Tax=Pseudomonas fluorescens TaxID=294 RepID=A0A5E7N1W7_PSEFL|nr:hypothetical protein [Pseudomonas fluorescens]VVP31001.1 hypothetical protein PS880_04338 [Pseudomonas fluorescens]